MIAERGAEGTHLDRFGKMCPHCRVLLGYAVADLLDCPDLGDTLESIFGRYAGGCEDGTRTGCENRRAVPEVDAAAIRHTGCVHSIGLCHVALED